MYRMKKVLIDVLVSYLSLLAVTLISPYTHRLRGVE